MQVKNPRLRLRSIFVIVVILALFIPLAGILFLRVYENILVRQTERELISQAAVIGASYKQHIQQQIKNDTQFGIKIPNYDPYKFNNYYTPILPQLDLAQNQVLPPRPAGINAQSADSVAVKAGAKITQIFTEAQKTTLSGMLLLDYNGVAISGQANLGLSFAHIIEVQNALAGNYHSTIRKRITNKMPALASISRGTALRVFVAMPVMQGDNLWGVVYLSRTPQNILQHLYAERGKLIIVCLALLAIMLAIAFMVSSTITRPIDKLLAKIKRVNNGADSYITPLTNPRTVEVDKLSQSFANITKLLHGRSEYIKNFATHVSHEFKTPITSIQGAAELLLENKKQMPIAQRNRFLNNILTDTNRLQALVSRLLELARADNYSPSDEVADLNSVLKSLASNYYGQGLQVSYDNSNNIKLAISAEALQIVFTNLLDNAKQHNATNVSIKTIDKNDNVNIIISDNGDGISESNKDKIFTPFFTTKRSSGGTGLGLAIIQSILKAHGGGIHITESTHGSTFKITLKNNA